MKISYFLFFISFSVVISFPLHYKFLINRNISTSNPKDLNPPLGDHLFESDVIDVKAPLSKEHIPVVTNWLSRKTELPSAVVKEFINFEKTKEAQTAIYANLYGNQLLEADLRMLDATHVDQLEHLVFRISQESDATLRLRLFQQISTITTINEHINTIFRAMDINFGIINKDTVKIFDDLLPALKSIDTFFTLFSVFSNQKNSNIALAGRFSAVWQKFYALYRQTLKTKARQLYLLSLSSKNKKKEWESFRFLCHAQGLLYRLQKTDSQAAHMFVEFDQNQKVPFQELVQLMAQFSISA